MRILLKARSQFPKTRNLLICSILIATAVYVNDCERIDIINPADAGPPDAAPEFEPTVYA